MWRFVQWCGMEAGSKKKGLHAAWTPKDFNQYDNFYESMALAHLTYLTAVVPEGWLACPHTLLEKVKHNKSAVHAIRWLLQSGLPYLALRGLHRKKSTAAHRSTMMVACSQLMHTCRCVGKTT